MIRKRHTKAAGDAYQIIRSAKAQTPSTPLSKAVGQQILSHVLLVGVQHGTLPVRSKSALFITVANGIYLLTQQFRFWEFIPFP